MPVYCFSVRHRTGLDDHVIASGETVEAAHAVVATNYSASDVDITQIHLGDLLDDHYNGMVVLVPDAKPAVATDIGDLFLAEEDRLLRKNAL